ncbi:anthranilate synthase component 2 [Catalinimonas alkaloidigena]|uniref:Anthranilate synthase component 2 n=1 Tax=Catalinimonas alkaloidigena TaxID=1075417 RepID=A0A1G9DUE7_9BACT|nr:aminodeoxychorismate/anthranilate synthase component II [Catalinimonas alkaloidigena]SDK67491.1 anthranilate synthase component 2 [Catalinimonas alkaloidigena]
MLLLIDNYDSFTFNLVDYFARLGVICSVRRNDEPPERLFEQPVDGVVLSPGPGTPQQAGRLMEVIDHYHQRLPMLGICLGHQALGVYFGAELIKAAYPMHGKLSQVQLSDDSVFRTLPPQINVVRYHSLLLDYLPASLQVTARTKQGEIMGLAHRTWPLHGWQFHPEAALTEYGLQMLKNWVDLHHLSDCAC